MTSRTLRYLALAMGVGILFLICCTRADAQSPFWRSRPATPAYSFGIEDANGNSLPAFVENGSRFVLGESGQRYNVRLYNRTGQRVEAVLSVDGRDAMSGDPGDYVTQRGYVIPAYGSLLVEGFRRSLEEVAEFRFTRPEDSYSARMGTPENVGVIGVAFFAERARPPAPRPVLRRPAPAPYDESAEHRARDRADIDRAAPERREAKGAGSSQYSPSGDVNNLGTQFGETRESVVTSVPFERATATRPSLVATLRYDDAEGLSQRGIDLTQYFAAHRVEDAPQAFPASHFAQPPPGER